MDDNEYQELKAKFLRTFANVPQPLRKEIIVVIGEDTFNWSTAKAEIMHNTEKAAVLLERLKEIGVL
ncbi:MAG: hypothetical protein U9Q22_04665 [Candidatus Altiarchaeota archaeon]|nr:hypothetical protein [Candidatus Altiarchaeota archaeon]